MQRSTTAARGRRLRAGLACLCWWLAACSGRASPGLDAPELYARHAVQPAQVLSVTISLAAHARLVLETRQDEGAPVELHLWDEAAGAELARARAWPHGLRGARLQYQSPHDQARSYRLLVHAAVGGGQAHVDLLRDGQLLVQHAQVVGAPLPMASGPGLEYRVARMPQLREQARAQPVLYALNADGALVAIAQPEGALGLPRIAGRADITTLLLAADGGGHTGATGPLDVYANDLAQDADGDGVGRELERALGSCDGPSEPHCARGPLASYLHTVKHASQDSDRDGISDGDELFGVEDGALDLPAWGADPRHKDVFVEVDRGSKVDGFGLSEDDLEGIAGFFAEGSASDLKNPDRKPGLQLHLDVGFAPTRARNAGLFGAWGGSSVASGGDYKQARNSDMLPARRRYFRYALLTRSGTGQATGSTFTINRDYHRVPVFAHEMAHTLGLKHHGSDAWGTHNCKPSYYSLMNYVYQNRDDIGLSRRAGPVLDPARVLESAGLGDVPADALREPPFELDVIGHAVDWNRDGVISDVPVRAGLTWATYKSCGSAGRGRAKLANEDVLGATPVLTRVGERLVALWLNGEGRLQLRSANARCAAGSDRSSCIVWAAQSSVSALHRLRHIAALADEHGSLTLGYVREDGRLGVSTLRVSTETVELTSDQLLPEAARSAHAPSLVRMPVAESYYGASSALGLFYRARADGALMLASSASATAAFTLRSVLDTRSRPLHSPAGPSMLVLGTGELCGALLDDEAFSRFYCYEPERDRFRDLSQQAFYAGLGPHSAGEVALGYHYYRDESGSPTTQDATRGALYLSFTEPESEAKRYPDNPNFLVSEWLSAEHGGSARIDFRWRGSVIDQWTNLAPGTRLSLYEDETSDALMALMTLRSRQGVVSLDFLPLADGSFDAELGSGNDFRAMERGICSVLRGSASCGGPETSWR